MSPGGDDTTNLEGQSETPIGLESALPAIDGFFSPFSLLSFQVSPSPFLLLPLLLRLPLLPSPLPPPPPPFIWSLASEYKVIIGIDYHIFRNPGISLQWSTR